MRDPREKVLDYGYFSEDGFHRWPDAPAVPQEMRGMVRKIAGMAQTNKEKQQDYRARMALLGMKEVRGIYLPDELHASVKSYALALLAKDAAEKLSASRRAASEGS